ncbi:ABC transporter permease [Dyella humicola]|uniref:ABC transporter permease n=1 Tax=Dyella humicola TaxID=2992126 RepID=UPI00224EA93D|nr:ABC transporter permease [Dyella humicola]
MYKPSSVTAMSDIAAAARRLSLVGILGWQDVRQRYRRSTLGPLWLTISMGVMIGTIGIVFGSIFKASMTEFLPSLASGIILWGFISTVINEGCSSFIASDAIIKQLPIPLFVHILRMMWRNMIMLGHNLLIFPIVLIAVGKSVHLVIFLSIAGYALLLLNLTWMTLILGVVCTRYRDLAQIVASALQVLFYLTPIVWLPASLPKQASVYLLNFNPVYHLLEIVRAPLLGNMPSATSWMVSGALALVGWALALVTYGSFRRRIAYWL